MKKVRLVSFLFLIVILAIVTNFVYLNSAGDEIEVRDKIVIFPEDKGQVGGSKENAILRNEEVVSAEKEFAGSVDDIIKFANEERVRLGGKSLTKNEKLNESAMKKAVDMKEEGYFDHVSPEGVQPWFFIKEVGYKYKTVGENLAEGYFSAKSVHDAWMQSPGHRENILSSDFEEIGVAILETKQNGQKSFLIVQHFGTILREQDVKKIVVCEEENKEWCDDLEDEKEKIKKLSKSKKALLTTQKMMELPKARLSHLRTILTI